MKTSELLIKAKALIDSPEKWTQGSMARLADGSITGVINSGAVCFCSIGAVRRASSDMSDQERQRVLWLATKVLGSQTDFELRAIELSPRQCVMAFNDKSDHAEVMEMFDKAISEAQSKSD